MLNYLLALKIKLFDNIDLFICDIHYLLFILYNQMFVTFNVLFVMFNFLFAKIIICSC
jgi:hypothetical protein